MLSKLMSIVCYFSNNIKTIIPQTESAEEYLKFVEECIRYAHKSLAGIIMAQPTTIKCDRSKSMQGNTIVMTNIAARLKSLGMTVDDSFMVQFILNSLPSKYGAFSIKYNTMKDKLDMNELDG